MSFLLCMNPCLDLKSSYINFIKWMERLSSVFLLYNNVYINNSGAICVLKTGQNSSAKSQESVLLSLVIYFNLFGFSIFCINCKNFLFWFDFLGFFSFFMAMLHACGILVLQPGLEPGPPQWKTKAKPLDCQGILLIIIFFAEMYSFLDNCSFRPDVQIH